MLIPKERERERDAASSYIAEKIRMYAQRNSAVAINNKRHNLYLMTTKTNPSKSSIEEQVKIIDCVIWESKEDSAFLFDTEMDVSSILPTVING